MTEREETEEERLNRNLEDALNEIRVAMPGVQVLFAFLLAVPFQQRFEDVTEFQKDVYFATLICAGVATACFIAPTGFHRVLFRQGEKERLVFFATRASIAGLLFLALAMSGAVLLVSDVLFSQRFAVIVSAALLAVFLVLWFAVPLRRRFD
ncbi:MAG: hypothetical protein JHC95_04585 [Solirubrobacteraceae bacterium]|nr:hypothetical protein [Solirubrobacteraceae bacterium]